MTSPAAPILPVAPPSQPSSSSGGSFLAVFSQFTDFARNGLPQRRAWPEFADRRAFAIPESVSHAVQRLQRNYGYFKVNYLCVIVSVLCLSLVVHPFSLFLLIGLAAAWLFLYLLRPPDHPLSFFGWTFSDGQTLTTLIICTIVVIFLTNIGSVLLTSLMFGCVLICLHGAFRTTDDLFLDEPDHTSAVGFGPYHGAAAAKTYGSTAPEVAFRI